MALQANERNLTGYITHETENVVFYNEDYTFHFMSPSTFYSGGKQPNIKPTEDGFLCGKTHNGHDIAIYVGNHQVSSWGCHTFHTSAYILSKSNVMESNLSGFWGIEFVGGTLNSLFDRSSNDCNWTDSGEIVVKLDYSKKEFKLKINEEECKIVIGSTSNFGSSIHGAHVSNNGVYFRIEFSKKKSRVEAFHFYSLLQDLMAFMTRRENVGIEKIYLLREKDEHGLMHAESEMHIKNDCELTKKHFFSNIQFEDLDSKLIKLVEILLKNTDKEPTYMLGFLPENDNDALLISNEKVKEICSSLECELTYVNDICVEENANLKELVNSIKKIVKEHKKTSKSLSSKTYDVINGSLEHITMSASDRIIHLYEKYSEVMRFLHPLEFPMDIKKDISEFIKYRNDITHGRHRVMETNIGITGIALQGLVYCCLLTRIGFEKSDILKLSQEHKLGERFL